MGDTPYGKLDEEQQLYIWYVYTSLKDRGVFNTANVDTDDNVYKDWTEGNGTSLKELLTHGISKTGLILIYFHLNSIQVFRSHMMHLLII